MAKLRSPGQKRKVWIRTVMIVLAVLGLSAAYFIKGPEQVAAIQLAKQHAAVEATVSSLDQTEEEYRGRKGRKKTRIVYSVSYAYEVGGKRFEHNQSLTSSEYDALDGHETLPVWFPEGKPENAKPQFTIEHLARESGVERVIEVGTWFLPVMLVLTIVLTLIFGREPKGSLPQGFYTENSWLDVEDDRLIVLEGKQLLSVSFESKHTDQVQEIYQRGGLDGNFLAEILAKVQTKQTLIDLDTVTQVSSEHHSDTISLTYPVDGKEKSTSLEFLSATVKEHALKRIARALPAHLHMNVEKLTRLQAARGALIVGLIGVGVIYYFLDHTWVVGLVGLLVAYSLKTVIARLIDPTVTTTFAAVLPVTDKAVVNS